jgi:hypothetical protein
MKVSSSWIPGDPKSSDSVLIRDRRQDTNTQRDGCENMEAETGVARLQAQGLPNPLTLAKAGRTSLESGRECGPVTKDSWTLDSRIKE